MKNIAPDKWRWKKYCNIIINIIKNEYNHNPTCVGVKADCRVEPLPMFQDVQRQRNLRTLSLLLDPQQRPLQVQPETNLLKSGARRRITIEIRHLQNSLDLATTDQFRVFSWLKYSVSIGMRDIIVNNFLSRFV